MIYSTIKFLYRGVCSDVVSSGSFKRLFPLTKPGGSLVSAFGRFAEFSASCEHVVSVLACHLTAMEVSQSPDNNNMRQSTLDLKYVSRSAFEGDGSGVC